MKLNNKYYILRHGEALSNAREIVSSWPEKFNNHLTKKGKLMVKEAAFTLKNKNIDLIFVSPLLRTRQTAEIVGNILKIKPKIDKRLREIGFGVFNSKPIFDFHGQFKKEEERINHSVPKGETYADLLKRVSSFLKDVDKKYKNKNILIISHECPLFLLEGKVKGFSLLETIHNNPFKKRIHKSEVRKLN
ncbi:MAG: histidine phosphatase family protein [Candidatus Staskawiczbacteria bacterium]|nr:histidine phosphatase family protein [Candidatus Staskawiczbacteria bacterium]MBI3337650.1 histidine phosphatase family protein [Candidatus Staskawiczbacteria bacterium]